MRCDIQKHVLYEESGGDVNGFQARDSIGVLVGDRQVEANLANEANEAGEQCHANVRQNIGPCYIIMAVGESSGMKHNRYRYGEEKPDRGKIEYDHNEVNTISAADQLLDEYERGRGG